MKIAALIMAGTLALPLSLPAAAHGSGEHRADKVINALELDDGRAEEVRQLMQDFHAKVRAHREKARAELKPMHEEHRQQLQQVLTEEEMAELDELKSRMKSRKHKKPNGDREHYHD